MPDPGEQRKRRRESSARTKKLAAELLDSNEEVRLQAAWALTDYDLPSVGRAIRTTVQAANARARRLAVEAILQVLKEEVDHWSVLLEGVGEELASRFEAVFRRNAHVLKRTRGRILVPRKDINLDELLLGRAGAWEELGWDGFAEVLTLVFRSTPERVRRYMGHPASMMSGQVGLARFQYRQRGYLYREPDFGIGDWVRVLVAWEPNQDEELFRAALAFVEKEYAWEFEDFLDEDGQPWSY